MQRDSGSNETSSADHLEFLPVEQLKEMLCEKGLKMSGTKAELLERLVCLNATIWFASFDHLALKKRHYGSAAAAAGAFECSFICSLILGQDSCSTDLR